jgi:nucleoside-diphosphate-sugar epimerase
MSGRWAITGASGFIGRSLLRSLDRDGISARTLSRSAIDRADHITADLRDPDALRSLVSDACVVVHLAAFVHRAARTEAEKRECFDVNVGGTESLVRAIADAPSQPFLVYVSSSSVYGQASEPLAETATLAPVTPYGESKVQAERVVLSAPIRATVLRPGMVFGDGAHSNLDRLIRVVRRGVVIELGGGRQKKTIVPIENFVAAIRTVAERPDVCAGEIFNVGGPPLMMRDVVNEIATALGVRPLRISAPLGAARVTARLVDAVLQLFTRAPESYARLVDAYGLDAVLDDSKLRSRTGYRAPIENISAAIGALALRVKAREETA